MCLIIKAGHLLNVVLRHLIRPLHIALVQHHTPQQHTSGVLSCHGLGQVRNAIRHAGGSGLVALYVAEGLGAVFRYEIFVGYQGSNVHIGSFGLHDEGTFG